MKAYLKQVVVGRIQIIGGLGTEKSWKLSLIPFQCYFREKKMAAAAKLALIPHCSLSYLGFKPWLYWSFNYFNAFNLDLRLLLMGKVERMSFEHFSRSQNFKQGQLSIFLFLEKQILVWRRESFLKQVFDNLIDSEINLDNPSLDQIFLIQMIARHLAAIAQSAALQ